MLSGWIAFAVTVIVGAGLMAVLIRWSGRAGWGQTHVLSTVAGAHVERRGSAGGVNRGPFLYRRR